MAASTEVSAIISACISIVLIAGMQIYKNFLSSSQLMTILGGYIGSWVFIFSLATISNFEMACFGSQFQSKFFEVIFSLLTACFVSGLVHRVSVTTCIIFSMVALYYVNKISSQHHVSTGSAHTANPIYSKKRR